MDEKILDLLGTVVAQNSEMIKQNREFLDFLKDRDAHHAEFEKLTLDINKQDQEQREQVYKSLGIGRGDMVAIGILREIGLYDAGKELRERLKAAGKLPEKAE